MIKNLSFLALSIFLSAQSALGAQLFWETDGNDAVSARVTLHSGQRVEISAASPEVVDPARDAFSVRPTFADGTVGAEQMIMLTVSDSYNIRIVGNAKSYRVVTTKK